MNCDNPIPRVGFAQLKNYINKKVLFVGKIESMNNGVVNMQAPDGSKVVVQANSHYDTPIVEVCGVVMDPMTIKEESHVNFGENFGKPATVLAVHQWFHKLTLMLLPWLQQAAWCCAEQVHFFCSPA
jgi:hypothetical protein